MRNKIDMNLNFEARFDTICVIESLRQDDVKTGTKLYENVLIPLSDSNPGLKVSLACVNSKKMFLKILGKIRDDVISGSSLPLLHIECHGDVAGFQFTDYSIIEWDELKDELSAINEASNMNLIIAVAACNGGHLIKSATQLKRAPFSAVIGTEGTTYEDYLIRDFSAFYRRFFDGDSLAALEALNADVEEKEQKYHLLTAMILFKRAVSHYKANYLEGTGLKRRASDLAKRYSDSHPDTQNLEHLTEMFQQKLLDEAPAKFQEYKESFFYIHRFPDNDMRFPIFYEDV